MVGIFNCFAAKLVHDHLLKLVADYLISMTMNFVIIHIEGSDNSVVDALSRCDISKVLPYVSFISPSYFDPVFASVCRPSQQLTQRLKPLHIIH